MAEALTTVAVDGPVALQVRLGHGRLRIALEEGAREARVRLAPRDGGADLLERVTVELRGDTLVVAGPRQGGLVDVVRGWRDGRDALDATIEVPAGSRITVASASEDIAVAGRCADADVATAATSIRVDTVGGDLRLRYGHAQCRVGPVTGRVRLSGGGGDAHVGAVGGTVAAKLGRGDLELATATGDVHVRTGHGAVRVGAVQGNLDIATGFGPITLGIPSGVAARVDASTGSGQVVSDLPLDRAPARGAATVTVRARTGKGDVLLQRSGAAAG